MYIRCLNVYPGTTSILNDPSSLFESTVWSFCDTSWTRKEYRRTRRRWKPSLTSQVWQNTRVFGFFGLYCYYCRFVKVFSCISSSLHSAKSIVKPFTWTDKNQEASVWWNEALNTPPFLAFPHFHKPFIVETYKSSSSSGAVIYQEKEDGKLHPIQYKFRTWTSEEKNYPTSES